MIAYPLLCSVVALVLAQAIKIPIFYFISRKWVGSLLFSTGGMPSSHTATVMALTTSLGLTEGWGSNLFIACLVFSAIVMHDAAGVRRHAGYHAKVLNELIQDFNELVESLKKTDFRNKDNARLKEILGHKPIEVFFGALFGICIALVLYPIYMD